MFPRYITLQHIDDKPFACESFQNLPTNSAEEVVTYSSSSQLWKRGGLRFDNPRNDDMYQYDMLKYLATFVAGVLVCCIFLLSSNQRGLENIQQEHIPTATGPRTRGATTRSSATTFGRPFQRIDNPTPLDPSASDADLKQLQDARSKDVRRSVTEDVRALAAALTLSDEQQKHLTSALEKFRLATELPEVTEYDLITSELTPEQIPLYEQQRKQRQRSDAALFASTRLHSIERVTGPLSDSQQDAIFQAIAASLTDNQVVSDADILKRVLSERQYALWAQSSEAEPADVENP